MEGTVAGNLEKRDTKPFYITNTMYFYSRRCHFYQNGRNTNGNETTHVLRKSFVRTSCIVLLTLKIQFKWVAASMIDATNYLNYICTTSLGMTSIVTLYLNYEFRIADFSYTTKKLKVSRCLPQRN